MFSFHKFYGLVLLCFFSVLPSVAQAQPTLNVGFSHSTIGINSTSRLVFDIGSSSASVVTGVGFSVNLPAGLLLSDTVNLVSSCSNQSSTEVISAANGGTVVSLADVSLAALGSCSLQVNVVSSTAAVYTIPAITLSSSQGSSMSSSTDLTVTSNSMGFTKAFAPSMVPLGSRSTLTFTMVNNSGTDTNSDSRFFMRFTDDLPAGMVVASPANTFSNCDASTSPIITAVPGSSVIGLSDGSLGINSTCTVSVDVVSSSVGENINQSGELTSNNLFFQPIISGFSAATLLVTADQIVFTKDFVDDPVVPGAMTTLRFNLVNTDRSNDATGLSFTDDLDAMLTGATAVGLPLNDVCGVGSTLSGSSLLSFSSGSLPAGGSCSFDVTVAIPATSAIGQYTNTSSVLSGNLAGSAVNSSSAVSILFVQPIPLVTKSFINDPVGAGSDVTLEFTVTNTSTTLAATNINFVDDLISIFPASTVVTPLNIPDACGVGSAVNVTVISAMSLALTNGTLPAGGSCTFSIAITVPNGLSNGIYENITGSIFATINGTEYVGNPATDNLIVVAAPKLSKSFTNDPVIQGDIVNLEFSLSHDVTAAGDATGISFTDDLNATLAGLTALNLPINDICGIGSSLSGTTNLSFTGGTLQAGETCTFSVDLQLPAVVTSGLYANVTSPVSATVLGIVANGSAASDDLQVSNFTFTKTFLSSSVQPGGLVDLQFTIDNQSMADATGMAFFDNLNDVLPGSGASDLTVNGALPTDPCGIGSTISEAGTGFLILQSGNLLASTSCTFTVSLLVPANAPTGSYVNTTTDLTISTPSLTLPPASDSLNISSNLLSLSKEFTDDPVAPGGLVNLQFTLENFDLLNAASAVAFTDDLDAALTGMVVTGLPFAACDGTVDAIPDSSTIDFSAGTLAAGEVCTFNVSVQVPVSASVSSVVNTTSAVTGMVNGLPADGAAATAELSIKTMVFTKSFGGPTTAAASELLTYTITNIGQTAQSDFKFNDDLDAVISGLVATGLPLNDSCGIGSTVAGTSLVLFTGGNLPAMGGTCSFSVPVSIPANATAGSYPSSTSAITALGLNVADPALDTLVIEPPPVVSKSFAPNSIGLNQNSLLSIVIDNGASSLDANGLTVVDNFPVGMVLDTLPVVASTCVGTLTANAGDSFISLSGGTVFAGEGCTIQVRVVGVSAGTHINTTANITSTSGNSGSATASLTVNPQPLFSKQFAANPIFFGSTSTLTFTIDNSASTVSVGSLTFSDSLPAGMIVATPSNASTTCSVPAPRGGVPSGLSAISGSNLITLSSASVVAGATCTVQVDVETIQSGVFVNVSGNLSSSLGLSGTATDTLVVNPPPAFSKQFIPVAMAPNNVSQLSLLIDNSGSTVNASALDFTDTFPANLVVATPANASTTCGGGSLTAVSGSSTVSYTGGSLNAGSSCSIVVDVTSAQIGNYTNLTGALTSNHGNSGSATASLLVTNTPLFTKAFATNPDIFNNANTLTFTVDNTGNNIDVSNLAFIDNLPTGFQVASPENIVNTCTGGTITAVSGTTSISYSAGTVSASSSCTIAVDVVATAAGAFTNITSILTTSLGDGNAASAPIVINPPPAFSKTFAPDVVFTNEVSRLTFVIDNSTSTVDASNLAFTDNFPANVAIANPANLTNTCAGTVNATFGSGVLVVGAATVVSGSSCEIALDVTGSLAGVYVNTSSDLTSSLGNSGTASDTLTVTDTPLFSKAFQTDPMVLAAVNTLTFTIDNSANNVAMTGLSFNDAMPNGFQVANPANTVNTCAGVVTAAVNSSNISLTGGSVNASESCSIAIDVVATVAGSFTNTTSILTTNIGPSNQAIATIVVNPPPVFSKTFSPAVINPGAVSSLLFTLDNSASTVAATNFTFIDNLPAGVFVASNPNVSSSCVAATTSAVANSATISVTSGTVAANSSCQISVDVSSASIGLYNNVTADLTSSLGNSGTASASLNVLDGIMFSKSFASFVTPGGDVTLSFVLENNTITDASAISFSDNLSALINANATNLPLNNVCGLGSQMLNLGSGNIQLTGAQLASGDSCQIDVIVNTDVSVAPGVYTNTTSALAADFNGITVQTPAASDDLTVVGLQLTKEFLGEGIRAGGTVEMLFTLNNTSTVDATQITFSDDLSNFIAGATANNLPINDVCGVGSTLTGSAQITLQNATVNAGSSCQFSVIVAIPVETLADSYVNITSPVDSNFDGFVVSGNAATTASAALYVNAAVILIPLINNWLWIAVMMVAFLLVFYQKKKRDLG